MQTVYFRGVSLESMFCQLVADIGILGHAATL